MAPARAPHGDGEVGLPLADEGGEDALTRSVTFSKKATESGWLSTYLRTGSSRPL